MRVTRGGRGKGQGRGKGRGGRLNSRECEAMTPTVAEQPKTGTPTPSQQTGKRAAAKIDDESHPNVLLNTEDISLISHTHGRSRRMERDISRLELQAAIKYGRKEPAHPSAQGRLTGWVARKEAVSFLCVACSVCRLLSSAWPAASISPSTTPAAGEGSLAWL